MQRWEIFLHWGRDRRGGHRFPLLLRRARRVLRVVVRVRVELRLRGAEKLSEACSRLYRRRSQKVGRSSRAAACELTVVDPGLLLSRFRAQLDGRVVSVGPLSCARPAAPG